MSKKIIGALAAVCSIFGCSNPEVSQYPQDTIIAKDGTKIVLTFYNHASIAIEAAGRHIYFDPVDATKEIDWKNEPKADLILITHDHYDHFSDSVNRILNGTGEFKQMKPGESFTPFEGVQVEAVPAYNISEGHLDFHPKERGDAGYILTIGGTRIYVAGDTEDNEDVLAIRDIDVAFLPVNQPYTMTVEQCARVIASIRPTIFYPYHYAGGDPEMKTDLDALKAAVEGLTEIRIRPLE
ncbi:MAG: MBL fold metallo-hydrolase [Bacteroidales bacterium]|nr:MBL fold metallo-hydrolase [Candidatus Cacconaster merdequi]